MIDIQLFRMKNDEACIDISDTGKGMAGETIESIFDPFFTTKPDGTGLGLSIVHRIIESYGSRLDVQSVKDEGTTFSLKMRCVN